MRLLRSNAGAIPRPQTTTASYGNPSEIRPNFGAALITQTSAEKSIDDRIVPRKNRARRKLLAAPTMSPRRMHEQFSARGGSHHRAHIKSCAREIASLNRLRAIKPPRNDHKFCPPASQFGQAAAPMVRIFIIAKAALIPFAQQGDISGQRRISPASSSHACLVLIAGRSSFRSPSIGRNCRASISEPCDLGGADRRERLFMIRV
jgi:hypothetical protein